MPDYIFSAIKCASWQSIPPTPHRWARRSCMPPAARRRPPTARAPRRTLPRRRRTCPAAPAAGSAPARGTRTGSPAGRTGSAGTCLVGSREEEGSANALDGRTLRLQYEQFALVPQVFLYVSGVDCTPYPTGHLVPFQNKKKININVWSL